MHFTKLYLLYNFVYFNLSYYFHTMLDLRKCGGSCKKGHILTLEYLYRKLHFLYNKPNNPNHHHMGSESSQPSSLVSNSSPSSISDSSYNY